MPIVTYYDLDRSAPRVGVQVVNPSNGLAELVEFVDGVAKPMDIVPAKLRSNPWFKVEEDDEFVGTDSDREDKLARLKEAGVKVDRRWGGERIAEEMAKAGLA